MSVNSSNIEVIMDGAIPSATVESRNASKEVVSQVVVDEAVAKDNQTSLVETTGFGSYPPLPTQGTTTIGNTPSKSSYANVTGKRVAYLVVANYVRNTWSKYGMVRSMFSSSIGLFSFQCSSMDGLDAMLENGLWFIRNNPLILKKWHLDMNILKEDIGIVLVWVKLHGVPVMAFSEDGLSAIATKLGTPLLLDSYTSDMWMQSWGKSSYVRAMIELRADVELKDNIVAAMPKINGEGYDAVFLDHNC
nr:hypothetical protein [Tanacetum cinerariifolium]